MAYRIEAACGCHTGRRRRSNEDNFCFDNRILPKENNGLKAVASAEGGLRRLRFFGVFDGMGGESFGEEASYLAAAAAQNSAKRLADFIYPPGKYLCSLVQKMNGAICEKSAELQSGRMGSTAVMLYLNREYAYMCNVGDSRAFCLRAGALEQVSKDHTDEGFLREQGVIGRKPSLTQHLGIWPEEMALNPCLAKRKMEDGDQYLLCSDGLTDMVDNRGIYAALEEAPDARQGVERLIAKALENGGRDNVTVILVRIKKAGKEEADENEHRV